MIDLNGIFQGDVDAYDQTLGWILENGRAESAENFATVNAFFMQNGGLSAFVIMGGDWESEPTLVHLYFEPLEDESYMIWGKILDPDNCEIKAHARSWRNDIWDGDYTQLNQMKKLTEQLERGPIRAEMNGITDFINGSPFLYETLRP